MPEVVVQPSNVPVKTAAGTDEISTRRHRLSTRSRSILIAIDGHHSVAQLQMMFAAFGDIGLLLDELAALGLVEGGGAPMPRGPAPPAPTTAPASTAPAAASAATTESPLMQARRLMNEVAVASLGFRAFGFTLKLEHCYSAEELRGLLPTFLQLITKAKGAPRAEELQLQIERLIASA